MRCKSGKYDSIVNLKIKFFNEQGFEVRQTYDLQFEISDQEAAYLCDIYDRLKEKAVTKDEKKLAIAHFLCALEPEELGYAKEVVEEMQQLFPADLNKENI